MVRDLFKEKVGVLGNTKVYSYVLEGLIAHLTFILLVRLIYS